jgi:hypothetical protein
MPERIELLASEPAGEERDELLRELMFALIDKHGGLTVNGLCELINQLIMDHGLRDATKFV